MKDIINGEVIVRETGEIVEGITIPKDSPYTIINKVKEQNRKNFLVRKENKTWFEELTGRFTFTLVSTIRELNHDNRFTLAEKTRIMFLGTYVSYQNHGSYLKFDNGRYICKRHLQEMLEIKNRREFYHFYNKLVETKILTEEVIDRSTIKLRWSNMYHFRGKAPASELRGKNLIKTFDKQIRGLFKEKDTNGKALYTPNNLYTMFMVLPYVHPETNLLCMYPNNDLETCEPLSISELSRVLGFTRSNDLKRKLFKVRLKGLPVFETRDNGIYSYIQVNPFVIWRSNKTPSEALLVTFRDTADRLSIKLKDRSFDGILDRIEGESYVQ